VLSKELKANVSSVPLVLGGGMYRHLGLLLPTRQYATLSEEVFKSPTNPGPFTRLKRGILIAIVLYPVEPPYPATMRSSNKSQSGNNILKILQHLSSTYSHITPQQLKAKEMEICNMQLKKGGQAINQSEQPQFK